jgi:hypothetical protein
MKLRVVQDVSVDTIQTIGLIPKVVRTNLQFGKVYKITEVIYLNDTEADIHVSDTMVLTNVPISAFELRDDGPTPRRHATNCCEERS